MCGAGARPGGEAPQLKTAFASCPPSPSPSQDPRARTRTGCEAGTPPNPPETEPTVREAHRTEKLHGYETKEFLSSLLLVAENHRHDHKHKGDNLRGYFIYLIKAEQLVRTWEHTSMPGGQVGTGGEHRLNRLPPTGNPRAVFWIQSLAGRNRSFAQHSLRMQAHVNCLQHSQCMRLK